MRSAVVTEYCQAKRLSVEGTEFEDNESSDEEEEVQSSSIKSFNVALTISKDILLFLLERRRESS